MSTPTRPADDSWCFYLDAIREFGMKTAETVERRTYLWINWRDEHIEDVRNPTYNAGFDILNRWHQLQGNVKLRLYFNQLQPRKHMFQVLPVFLHHLHKSSIIIFHRSGWNKSFGRLWGNFQFEEDQWAYCKRMSTQPPFQERKASDLLSTAHLKICIGHSWFYSYFYSTQ